MQITLTHELLVDLVKESKGGTLQFEWEDSDNKTITIVVLQADTGEDELTVEA